MSKKRLITSAAILLAVVALFFTRMWTLFIFDIAIGVLAVIACIEVSKVAYEAGKVNSVYFVSTYPAVLYLLTMLYVNNKFSFTYLLFYFLLVFLGYFLATFLVTLFAKSTSEEIKMVGYSGTKAKFALDKAMFSLALLIYPAVLFETLIILNHVLELSSFAMIDLTGNSLSYFVLISVFAVTMVTDSMAMVTGIVVKGKKLCPNISPNKTISGAVGGLIGGILSAVVVYLFFTLSSSFVADFSAIGGTIWHIFILGLLGSVFSQVGDILASLLKRHAQVKDYGDIFPGHGGVMDRVDGLIFNSTFVLLFFTLIIVL